MTIQANQGFGVSIFGATSAGGGGSTSPGGSSGQLQYNASGSFGGMAGTSWDDTNRALTLTGATVTTSQPVLNLSQTWNAGAVTFTGLKFNATDTASAAASLLLDLQVGGTSRFSVRASDGAITGGKSPNTTFPFFASGLDFAFWISGTAQAGITGNGFSVPSTKSYVFSSTGAANGTPDIYLTRDAANTLALRNGATAQTFNVYETYTDPANYSRLSIGNYSSGRFSIIAYGAGGTTINRGLVLGTNEQGSVFFQTNNVIRWLVNASTGALCANTDNTVDIGATSSLRPRSIYTTGGYAANTPATKTANYSQGADDFSLIFNGSGSLTLTLLAAASYPGKVLRVKTIAAQTVVSASSNVCPVDSSTAGTAILPATAGAWAMLQSDGTNWIVMAKG